MALRLRGATSGYIELKAPASAGDNTLTLPTNNGSANQLLKTDGNGNLSWVDDNSGVSLSGSTNNTIATVTGANALAGEANFTFDGDTAAITRSANTAAGLSISNTNNSQGSAIAQLELSGGDNAHARLQFECNGIYNTIRSDGSGNLKFFKGSDERLNISSVGDVAIGGCAVNTFNNYQTLTIGGARAVDGVGIDLEKSDGNIYGRLFADGNGLQIGAPQAGDYIRFEVESDEKARIDSSGRLLVGTTTEGFATYGDKFTIADSGHCGMTIRSGTSSDGNIFFSDGTSGSDEVRGFVEYNHSTNILQLGTNGASKISITDNGSFRHTGGGTWASAKTTGDFKITVSNLTANAGNTWRKCGVFVMYSGINADATSSKSGVGYYGVGSVTNWNWFGTGEDEEFTADSLTVTLDNDTTTSFRLNFNVADNNTGSVNVFVNGDSTKPIIDIAA